MISNSIILNSASISHAPFEGRTEIHLSKGLQLFGSYSALTRFRDGYGPSDGQKPYMGWEVHHIVEDQDLSRLGVAFQFPTYVNQLCVLLPRSAHVHRINNILRHRNPTRFSATALELLSAYREAYGLVGNYSGGGETLIKSELLNIVQASFRLAKASR
jgi:hypothetical protein